MATHFLPFLLGEPSVLRRSPEDTTMCTTTGELSHAQNIAVAAGRAHYPSPTLRAQQTKLLCSWGRVATLTV